MSKPIFAKNAFIEHTDLNRLVYLLQTVGYERLFKEFTETYGVIKRDSDGATALQIYQSSINKLGIKKGTAFTSDGYLIYVPADIPDILTMSADPSYKRVFIQAATTQIETGTISVGTNGNITGIGTEFLKLLTAVNKKIEILNSTLGNNGTFALDTVTSDTAAHSTTNFVAAESGLNFKVVSIFTPTYTPPTGEEKEYYYDTFNLTIESDATAEADNKFCLARFIHTTNGVDATITDIRTKVHKFKKSYETAFDKQFTTSSTFKIGTDSSGAGGKYVMTLDDAPSIPLNFKINDIIAENIIHYVDPTMNGKIPIIILDGLISAKAAVYLKWNWDNIQGYGSASTFVVQNGDIDLAADALIGYHFYVAQTSTDYIITANTIAVTPDQFQLTLTDLAGNAVNLTGLNITDPNFGFIHSNAEKYEIVATPYNGANQVPEERVEKQIIYVPGTKSMGAKLELFIGQKYSIVVRAITGIVKTAYASLPSGSFTKDSNFDPTTVPYSSPTIIKLPTITSTGASVGAIGTGFGFEITIIGWSSATDLEICYSDAPGGADFSNPDHAKMITSDRKINIVVNGTRSYSVKVRPLISGQQVATEIETKVTSGAGGNAPIVVEIGKVEVSLRTYSGTFSWNVGANAWLLAAVVSPASGTQSITSLGSSMIGWILTDSAGKDFVIDNVEGGLYCDLSPVDGVSTPTAGTFEINTSKRGRQVFKKLQPQDFMLVDGYVDTDTVVGSGGVVIRVYQEGIETSADTVTVTTKDALPFPTDLTILQRFGARYMIIDLWDPNGVLNKNGFTGTITIHALPSIVILKNPS